MVVAEEQRRRGGVDVELARGMNLRTEVIVVPGLGKADGGLDGADPDDMAVVYGILSDDGARGIVVDAYGVYADPRLSEFLKNVKIREDP